MLDDLEIVLSVGLKINLTGAVASSIGILAPQTAGHPLLADLSLTLGDRIVASLEETIVDIDVRTKRVTGCTTLTNPAGYTSMAAGVRGPKDVRPIGSISYSFGTSEYRTLGQKRDKSDPHHHAVVLYSPLREESLCLLGALAAVRPIAGAYPVQIWTASGNSKPNVKWKFKDIAIGEFGLSADADEVTVSMEFYYRAVEWTFNTFDADGKVIGSQSGGWSVADKAPL